MLLRPRIALVALALLAACSDRTTAPRADGTTPSFSKGTPAAGVVTPAIVRALAAGRGIVPMQRPRPVRRSLVRLGQALLFDRVLSGNRDIACATCHLPSFATGDGRSLSVGQGATGMGPDRVHPAGTFIARNAPPLFDLVAMKHLF
jgi:cytochrome c peroxidase